MSCIGFLSPQQRRSLRASSRDDGTLSRFASPDVTAGKLARARSMAASPEAGIRESAALGQVTPVDVLAQLAADAEPRVRMCVARNPRTPPDTLRALAGDVVPGVRGWVAANPGVPADVLDVLADDPDPVVRSVVTWARGWP
jgi:hypothetical protein